LAETVSTGDGPDVAASDRGGRRRGRRRWLVAFALIAALGTAWAVATPIFASPDEPAQVIRAVAVARGQLLGTEFGPHNVPPYPVPVDKKPWLSGLAVNVPAVYQHWGNINCVVFNLFPPATANCLKFTGGDHDARALTYVGRYPPWYYLGVGGLTRFVPAGRGQVYAMRILTVLLAAALLASAAVTLLELTEHRVALLGLAVAITPMTLFMVASVNSSAVEIAAAIGVWVHGLAMAVGPDPAVDRRLLDRFGVAAVLLVLARPGSMIWLALIVLVLAGCAGWHRLRALWAAGRARVWAAAVATAVVADLAWFTYADTWDLRRSFLAVPVGGSTGAVLRASLSQEYGWLRQMVGVFGWLDTPAPVATFAIWLAVLGLLLVAAVVTGRRFGAPLAAVLGLCVAVPVAYQLKLAHTIGYFWQGRYLLPLAAGVPIIAGVAVGLSRGRIHLGRRGVTVAASFLALASFLAFAEALRRYTVGIHGRILFFTAARWEPPIPSVLLLVLFAATLVGAVYALSRGEVPRRASSTVAAAA